MHVAGNGIRTWLHLHFSNPLALITSSETASDLKPFTKIKLASFLAMAAEVAVATHASESRFHVLAVDDNLVDRKLIERLLTTCSYQGASFLLAVVEFF